MEAAVGGFEHLKELLLQTIEHELGSVRVYGSVLERASKSLMSAHWVSGFSSNHSSLVALSAICTQCHIDPTEETGGRQQLRHMADAICRTIRSCVGDLERENSSLVCCRALISMERKRLRYWSLIHQCSEFFGPNIARALTEHDYHRVQATRRIHHLETWARRLESGPSRPPSADDIN